MNHLKNQRSRSVAAFRIFSVSEADSSESTTDFGSESEPEELELLDEEEEDDEDELLLRRDFLLRFRRFFLLDLDLDRDLELELRDLFFLDLDSSLVSSSDDAEGLRRLRERAGVSPSVVVSVANLNWQCFLILVTSLSGTESGGGRGGLRSDLTSSD